MQSFEQIKDVKFLLTYYSGAFFSNFDLIFYRNKGKINIVIYILTYLLLDEITFGGPSVTFRCTDAVFENCTFSSHQQALNA